MNGKQGIYLVLAVAGFAAPIAYTIVFVGDNGWDLSLFFQQITASTGALLILADLTISALAFLVFLFSEAPKRGMSPWPYLIVLLLIGTCFSFPLFMFNRERKLAATAGA